MAEETQRPWAQDFFCLWQHRLRESWKWRWRSFLACGDPGGLKCAGTRIASTAGVTALAESFWASCSWRSEGLFGQCFSAALPVPALIGGSLPGVLLCCLVYWAHKSPLAPSWGFTLYFSASAIWWASLSIVQLPLLVCRGREAWWWLHPCAWFSSIALLPWPPASLHRHFPPQSPPSHPLDPSLHSQQRPLPWDCSTIPEFQLPATAPSGVCMAVARTVWFSFHSGCHRSVQCGSVMSDYLPPSGLQHARPPCPSPTPDSCLLS